MYDQVNAEDRIVQTPSSRTKSSGLPCRSQWCRVPPSLLLLLLVVGILANLSLANPTNPVFIQRDLPPSPYAYGMQDFDSSEEVTIVKRSGQSVLPQVTYLTTPQSKPTPLAKVAQVQQQQQPQPSPEPLPVALPLQQPQQPPKPPKKAQQQQPKATSANHGPEAGGSKTHDTKSAPKTPVTNTSPEQTSRMELDLDPAPRPEDMPQPPELDNAIQQHHKRNVYNTYATESHPGSCGCGGYVLVEKKIYVCEPKETIVRLMKRSHDDVCAAQETQHVGVIQTPDNPEQMYQLIPMPDGM